MKTYHTNFHITLQNIYNIYPLFLLYTINHYRKTINRIIVQNSQYFYSLRNNLTQNYYTIIQLYRSQNYCYFNLYIFLLIFYLLSYFLVLQQEGVTNYIRKILSTKKSNKCCIILYRVLFFKKRVLKCVISKTKLYLGIVFTMEFFNYIIYLIGVCSAMINKK